MDTNKTEIIQKIKKLFALANGASTEEEAHNAMLRVKEMLTKYNLSMEEVQSFRIEECHGHSTKYIKSKYCPSYIKILALAVGKLFHCSTMTAKETIQNTYRLQIYFIGVDMDGLVASQTFDYLVEYATTKVEKQKVNKKIFIWFC